MKLKEKTDVNKNFTKLTQKRGISLIVLIVTIIVIIILAAAVILTITKNNPVSSAKEATFKEDMANIQDELSMYLSKKYTDNPLSFEKSSVSLSGDSMVTELPSTKKYKEKVSVVEGNLVLNNKKVNSDEKKWFNEVIENTSNVNEEWQDTIASVKYGVPIPKGFTYEEGTKDTGLVIQDKKGNEFVWVPATVTTYAKDTSFSWFASSCDTLPNGIADETSDVKKYGGFYIGRYEAGIPEGDTSTSNKTGIPVSKPGVTVWTNIDYTNAKASAEKMINNEYVQTGLLTGKAWDTTCHWIEDSLSGINKTASLRDSRYYGNYKDSESPANVSGYGTKQVAGYSDKWKVKNIYDLAGNVCEWTSEAYNGFVSRGGNYYYGGSLYSVSYCFCDDASGTGGSLGFRLRLYIK